MEDNFPLKMFRPFQAQSSCRRESDSHKTRVKRSWYLYLNPVLSTWHQTTSMKQTQEETSDFFIWNRELLLCLQGFRDKKKRIFPFPWKWIHLVCGWLNLSCFFSGRWFMVIRSFSPIPSQSSPGGEVLSSISRPFTCSSLLICWWKVNEPGPHHCL